MIAADIRDLNWEEMRQKLRGERLHVYEAWLEYGPGTTRGVSDRSGIGILTFRPRTTELLQIGLIELDPSGGESKARRVHEGVYRATPEQVIEERRRMSRVIGACQQLALL